MSELTITIETTSEGEYQYNIFNTTDPDAIDDPTNSIEGGVCTTTLRNALEMATEQVNELLDKEPPESYLTDCTSCGKEYETTDDTSALCITCNETHEPEFRTDEYVKYLGL